MQLVLWEHFLFLELAFPFWTSTPRESKIAPRSYAGSVMWCIGTLRVEWVPLIFSLYQPTSIHQHATLPLYFRFFPAWYIMNTSWHNRDCHVSFPRFVCLFRSSSDSSMVQCFSRSRLILQLASSGLRTILLNYHLTIAIPHVGPRRMFPFISYHGKYIFHRPIYLMQLSFLHPIYTVQSRRHQSISTPPNNSTLNQNISTQALSHTPQKSKCRQWHHSSAPWSNAAQCQ